MFIRLQRHENLINMKEIYSEISMRWFMTDYSPHVCMAEFFYKTKHGNKELFIFIALEISLTDRTGKNLHIQVLEIYAS